MEHAKSNLVWYIRTLWEAAGLTWSADNTAEVEDIVDSIMRQVRKEAKENAV